jgi:hypothetical protein
MWFHCIDLYLPDNGAPSDFVILSAKAYFIAQTHDLPRLRRFAQFELDCALGNFTRGKRIKLQSSRAMCWRCWSNIRRSGHPEELRKTLWPNDTFVDFDHGVNQPLTSCATPSGWWRNRDSLKPFPVAGIASFLQ